MANHDSSIHQSSISPHLAKALLPHAEDRLVFWLEMIKILEADMEVARAQYARVNAEIMVYREVLNESEEKK